MKSSSIQLILLFISSALVQCQTFQAPKHSERIDLNKVVMTSKQPEKKIVHVGKNQWGQNYIELDLRYAGSGINIIESIKSGEIWDHAIVVVDNEGNEIGREPINFQAFTLKTIETVTVEKDEQFVLSEDGSLFGKESEAKTSKSSHIDPNFQHKVYSDQDFIPQIIKIQKAPPIGSYISVFIELTYIAPFVDAKCANKPDGSPDESCPKLKNHIFQKVHTRNQLELERLQNAIRTKVFNPKEKATKADNTNPNNKTSATDQDDSTVSKETDLKFRSLLSDKKYSSTMYSYNTDKEYCNSVPACKAEMKKAIDALNSKESYIQTVTPEGNQLYYREWNLVSSPKYFRVESILGEKSEQKEKTKDEEEVIDLNEKKESDPLPRIQMPKPVD